MLFLMNSDPYKKDKEIWYMALWLFLALEFASEMIKLHFSVLVGLSSA